MARSWYRKSDRISRLEELEFRRVLHAPGTPVLELEASHGVVADAQSALVSQWLDQSTNGNDLLSSGTLRPSYGTVQTPSGLDALSFDGADDRLLRSFGDGINNLPAGNADRTTFMVVQFHDADAWSGFGFGAGDANEGFGTGVTSSGKVFLQGWGAGNDQISAVNGFTGAGTTGWMIVSSVLTDDGTSAADNAWMYVNGTEVVAWSHSYATDLSDAAKSRIVVGEEIAELGNVQMDVAAVLVYDSALPAPVRQSVEDYLFNEYLAVAGGGFADELVVGNVSAPIGLVSLPDGRMLIGEQAGTVKIVDPSAAIPTTQTYLTIPNVQSSNERGIWDFALDPDFANNNYVYVYYASSATNKARISRFVHNANLPINANTETVIWEDPETFEPLSLTCCHYGGGLDFGPDDRLYLTIGDKWRFPQDSQDLTKAGGKILRLNSDGTIPSGAEANPFADGPGGNLDEIWAYGLRNPFRANWDLPTGRFFIGDVGGNVQSSAFEEINLGARGVNYGWPNVEGIQGNPLYENPIFAYDHAAATPNGGAIAGGFVYRGTQFPSEYVGAYFYADYVLGWIRYLKFDGNGDIIDADPGTAEIDPFDFIETPIAPVALEQGADGALYYNDYIGQLRRVVFNSGNEAPVITSVSANPTQGTSVPLQVAFTSSATDAEMDPLTYTWDFGDGNQATGQNVTHDYLSGGSYSARLSVFDGFNTTVSNPIQISVGQAPVIQSISPADGTLFQAGDTITLSAVVTDDGPLDGSNYSWTVRFIHNAHTHPEFSNVSGLTATLDIPTTGHDFSDSTGFEIELTVTDADGIPATQMVSIFPDKVDVTFNTDFPGTLTYTLDGIPRAGNFVLDSAINFQHTISVPTTVYNNSTEYVFSQWSDGTQTASNTFSVPSSDLTLTAEYTATAGGGTPFNPVLDLQSDAGITQSGGFVSQWQDISGNANHVSAAGIERPEFGLVTTPTGKTAVSFDGDDDHLLRTVPEGFTGLPTGNADRTVFLVAQINDAEWSGGAAYGAGDLNQTFGVGVNALGGNAGKSLLQGWGNNNDLTASALAYTPPNGPTTGWTILTALHQDDGANSANNAFLYKDGAQVAGWSHQYNTNLSNAALLNGNDSISRIVLGEEIKELGNVRFDVAAYIIYDSALSSTDIATVEDFLANKYLSSTTLSIGATAAVKDEGNTGNTDFTFTVTRSGDLSGTSSVQYAVTGSGTNPANAADFGGTLPSGTVNFAVDEAAQVITVNVSGDTVVEANEEFTVTLSSPSAPATLGTATATGTINNDDSTTLSIGASAAVKDEGNTGNTDFTFTVTRSGDLSGTSSVQYAVTGSGTNPANAADFGGTLPSGTVNFAVDEAAQVITVNVSGDTVVEANEEFIVTLSSPSAPATLGTVTATGTINNDDSTTLSIGASAAVKDEGNTGNTDFTFTVTRSGDLSGTSSVQYAVTGSGTNPANAADFGGTLPSGTVNFAVDEAAQVITVNVSGDTVVEANEEFIVTLSSPSAPATLGTATATGTINNDDSTTLSIGASAAVKDEGNTGNTDFTFTVTRSGDLSGTSSVQYAVTGSGTNPANAADFGGTLPSGTVNFAVDEAAQVITVNVSGDTVVEANEEFTVTLSSPSAPATLGTATATGTINNDDGPPPTVGDFNDDSIVNHLDIDLLAAAVRAGSTDLTFDLDGDGFVTYAISPPGGVASDSDFLIRVVLQTEYADANLDYKVDISDLDLLGRGFQGEGTGWRFGDFNGSGGTIDISDLDLLGRYFGYEAPQPVAAGHVWGFDHGDEEGLMGETLEAGIRHLLAVDQIFSESGNTRFDP